MKKRLTLALCVLCLLATGCQTKDGLTASGSDEWSRGVVVGLTKAKPVAVAAWQETMFVVWAVESGQLRLAQLDAALNLQSETRLALAMSSTYARDLRLWVEAADHLHLAWVDGENGAPTVVHAQVAPGRVEPLSRREISLPTTARHIEMAVRPEAGRLDLFWSDLSNQNSGLYHQAVTLAGDASSPAVRLTETGWQPRVVWGTSGVMHIAWADWDREMGGYAAAWYARFDPESRSLDGSTLLARVRTRWGQTFQGSLVGEVGAQAVATWRAGNRIVERGLFDRHWYGSDFGGAFRSSHTTEGAIRGDDVRYALLSSSPAETVLPVHSLATGNVVLSWQDARMRTVEDRTWIASSAWVARRSSVRLQIILVPFDAQGQGEPVIVTKTWPLSMWPDLAVGADGALRAAWCEPLGNDVYQVVVASTAPEARDALGGFSPVEWWDDVLTLWTDFLGLMGLLPMVFGWVLAPLGLMLVGVFTNPDGLRKRQVVAWLGMAILLQLTGKWFLFPDLLSLGPDPIELGLTAAPIVLGIGLMWVYWRRADEPSLLAAYGLFAGTEIIFSLFVIIPRVLWAS